MRPFDRFDIHPYRAADEPRYFVAFDQNRRRNITGLRLRIKSLYLPDERILEAAHRFAESVWHLKDRLHKLVRAKGMDFDVENFTASNEPLLVCADLANGKNTARVEIARTTHRNSVHFRKTPKAMESVWCGSTPATTASLNCSMKRPRRQRYYS